MRTFLIAALTLIGVVLFGTGVRSQAPPQLPEGPREYVTTIDGRQIVKFRDGNVTCYFTIAANNAISCVVGASR
jgi:hypothetical protein